MQQQTTTCVFPDAGLWRARFQRNNKPNGLKNLRCFPHCGEDGKHHKQTGFCGQPVSVHVSLSPPRKDVRVYGELGLVSRPRWRIGDAFNTADADAQLRHNGNIQECSLQLAQPAHPDSPTRFSFELTRKGWHYGWVGSKHTSELKHAFMIYVCVPFKTNEMQVIGVFHSPTFTMFCRRRHHTVAEEDKMEMAEPLTPADSICVVPLLPDGSIDPPAPSPLPQEDRSDELALAERLNQRKKSLAAAAAANSAKKSPASSGKKSPTPSSSSKQAKKNTSKKSTPRRKRVEDGESDEDEDEEDFDEDDDQDEDDGFDPVPTLPSSNSKKPAPKKPKYTTTTTTASPPAPINAVQIDEKLVRVLSAICKLGDLQQQQHQIAHGTPKSSSPPPDDFMWIEPISDLFLDANLFDDIADIFGVDELKDLDASRSRAVEVVTALARFIVEETSLTEAIAARSNDTSSFEEFLMIFEREITEFLHLNFNGLTVNDLDAMLRGQEPAKQQPAAVPSMRTAFDTLVQAAVSRTASPVPSPKVSPTPSRRAIVAPPESPREVSQFKHLAFSRVLNSVEEMNAVLPAGFTCEQLLKPKPLGPNEAPPDVAGVWLRPEETVDEMDKMRERRGDMDWVQRKLLNQMEKRFELIQNTREDIEVRLSRKLLSPGICHYRLDGVVRPFVMIAPLGNVPAAKYCSAWAHGPLAIFRNTYNDTERMYRCDWKKGDGNLHSVHVYESIGGEGWGSGHAASSSSDSKHAVDLSKPWIINRMIYNCYTPYNSSSSSS